MLITIIEGDYVEANILLTVEIPFAIISVCVPNLFFLFKRGFYHGLPSLFSSRDPSKRVHGQYTEHIHAIGNPLENDVGRSDRLEGGKYIQSGEQFVLQTIATRVSDLTSQDIPLDVVQVRNDLDVQIDYTVLNAASLR